MKKPFFIFCLMFWAFAAGAYSQYKAGKVAGAVVKAVRAAGNIKPKVVLPVVPPVVPQPVPVTVYDTIIKKDVHPRVDSVTGRLVYDTVEYPYVIISVKWVLPKSQIKEASAEAADDTSAAAAIDSSSVSYAISFVNPPKERKTVSLLENDMPLWGWLLVAIVVVLGVYIYICWRSDEKKKEAQRRQEAARKSEEKREDKKSSAAPETQPRRQPSPKAPSAAKNEKPSGTLYVDSKGVVRKKIEEE